MRKLLIVLFEILVPPIILGWLFLKFPEIFDVIIPWIAFGWLLYLTWELALERESVKLYVGKAAERVGRMAWIFVFLIGGCLSLLYLGAIKKSLTALAAEHARIIKPNETPPKPAPPPGVLATGSMADYPSGAVIGGITWNSKFSDLRVTIFPHMQDLDDLDVLLQPDEPIAGIGQISSIPDVSFLINTTLSVPALELLDRSTGKRQARLTTMLAFNRGYRIRCPRLPKGSSLQIVMAIARPTGAKGMAISMSDGSTYWARTDADGVKGIEEYFSPKRLAKSMQIDGDYTVVGIRQHISMHVHVKDIVGDAIRKLKDKP